MWSVTHLGITIPKGWWLAHGGVVSVPVWCSDCRPIQSSCVQVCVICATVQDWSVLAPCTLSGNSFRHYCKCVWASEQSVVTKDTNPSTHIFSEFAIYMQELLRFWGISCASYFLFKESILFVSWYSIVITALQFLKERDPGRMRKRDYEPEPDPTWCSPIF